jgi:hypothetical protein
VNAADTSGTRRPVNTVVVWGRTYRIKTESKQRQHTVVKHCKRGRIGCSGEFCPCRS